MLEVVFIFINFPSFYTVWFGYNFVANRLKFFIQHVSSQELGKRLSTLPTTVVMKGELIRYSQVVNLVFIEHTYILLYMFTYIRYICLHTFLPISVYRYYYLFRYSSNFSIFLH